MIEERVWKEVCKRLEDHLQIHDKRLNDHAKRIDSLEQYRAGVEQRIEHLCEKIDGLISTIKWGAGLLIGSFVGFFFYAAQKGLIK